MFRFLYATHKFVFPNIKILILEQLLLSTLVMFCIHDQVECSCMVYDRTMCHNVTVVDVYNPTVSDFGFY